MDEKTRKVESLRLPGFPHNKNLIALKNNQSFTSFIPEITAWLV